MDRRVIDEDNAQYVTATRLLQNYLKDDGALVWVAKRGLLPNVWLGWIAAMLYLNGAYDDRL